MADANPRLLPCPFCGSSDLEKCRDEYGGRVLRCRNCDICGPSSEDNIAQIIAAWNDRPVPTLDAAMQVPEVRALVSALKLACYDMDLISARIDAKQIRLAREKASIAKSCRDAALAPFAALTENTERGA